MRIISREFVESDHNLRDAFFPVALCDLNYELPTFDLFGEKVESKVIPAKGFKAVVDLERAHVFATVTDNYQLVTNETAYRWSESVADAVFRQSSLNDFACFNVRMTESRSRCYIDLVRKMPQGFKMFNPFGDDDPWTAFLRIANSYNKTECLRYELGFCRWICKNGVIFSKKSVSYRFPHTKSILDEEKVKERLVQDASVNIGQIRKREEEFIGKLLALRKYALPASSMMALMCKVFGIKLTKNGADNLLGKKRESAVRLVESITRMTHDYFGQFGPNAYAALNVISDYASYPAGERGASFVADYQTRAGDWVDSFVEASAKPDFSMADYLGKEAVESAYWLESLLAVG